MGKTKQKMASSNSTSGSGGSIRPSKRQAIEEVDDIDRDEQILLLEDLQKYHQKYGDEDFRWKRFYKTTKLRREYTSKQLCRKTRELKESFERSNGPPPPGDPLHSRIYDLSNSIWAQQQQQPAMSNPLDFPRLHHFFSDVSVPQLFRNHWVLMGEKAAADFEKRRNNIHHRQVALRLEKSTLDVEICNMLAEIIPRHLQSLSSSGICLFAS